jgi:hypothetical protein
MGKEVPIMPNDIIIRRKLTAKQIAEMDAKYIRLSPTSWLPVIYPEQNLTSLFSDKITYIVGKGPSLDIVKPNDFEINNPIIAINEAFNVLSPMLPDLIAIQQDYTLGSVLNLKPTTIFLVAVKTANLYPDHPLKIIYTAKRIKAGYPPLSASCAIRLALHWGCRHFRMVAFDACKSDCIDYAKAIGHKPKGKPARFLEHRKIIESRLDGARIEWL